MSPSQDRHETSPPAGRAPAEPAPGRRSGEGAASALEQWISQNRQRQQDGLVERDPG